MAMLKIQNLQIDKQLDIKALKAIRGGMNFGWIRPYENTQGGYLAPIFIGQMTVMMNPVFNQITQTVNQVEFVTVETTENVDSSVNVIVGQGQRGNVGRLPSLV
jgi:hypothetical protein